MFINTKPEANIAAGIAHELGFTRLTPEDFYKRYDNNVFSPWASMNDAREAQERITEAVRADRASKRHPTPAEASREVTEERERTAHNISAATGEAYTDVLKRIG